MRSATFLGKLLIKLRVVCINSTYKYKSISRLVSTLVYGTKLCRELLREPDGHEARGLHTLKEGSVKTFVKQVNE